MSIELPKDAEGREIPLDTVVLFGGNGNDCHARHRRPHPQAEG